MPEWLRDLLQWLAASGVLAGVIGGIGWLFKVRRDDRNANAARRQAERKVLEDRVERLQAKVESLLMDAIARERDAHLRESERTEMDRKQNAIIDAATTALTRAAALLAKIEGGQ